MRVLRSLGLLLMVALFSVTVFSQSLKLAGSSKPMDDPSSVFYFQDKGFTYRIYSKSGKVRITKKGTSKSFNLPVDKDGSIAKVSYLKYKNGLLILLENNYGEGSDGKLIYLDTAAKKIMWNRQIPAFSIQGRIEENFIYLAGVGYLSKVNLSTGRIAWKHEDLYTERFGKIDVPGALSIGPKTVSFNEDEETAASRKYTPRRIVFDKSSGKTIRFDKN